MSCLQRVEVEALELLRVVEVLAHRVRQRGVLVEDLQVQLVRPPLLAGPALRQVRADGPARDRALAVVVHIASFYRIINRARGSHLRARSWSTTRRACPPRLDRDSLLQVVLDRLGGTLRGLVGVQPRRTARAAPRCSRSQHRPARSRSRPDAGGPSCVALATLVAFLERASPSRPDARCVEGPIRRPWRDPLALGLSVRTRDAPGTGRRGRRAVHVSSRRGGTSTWRS